MATEERRDSAADDSDDDVMFGLRRRPRLVTTTPQGAAAEAARHRPQKERHEPRGLVYFSSLPIDMRPSEIRTVFSKYGETFRQKFVPFAVKEGGKKSSKAPIRFKEAWLEFLHASDAQRAAEGLNATPVQTKRHRRSHGVLWTVRCLGPTFQWSHLVSEGEEARRDDKMAEYEERQKERKMNEEFRRMVQRQRDADAAAGKAPARAKAAKEGKRFVLGEHRNLWAESATHGGGGGGGGGGDSDDGESEAEAQPGNGGGGGDDDGTADAKRKPASKKGKTSAAPSSAEPRRRKAPAAAESSTDADAPAKTKKKTVAKKDGAERKRSREQ
jgi:hypothetical protein